MTQTSSGKTQGSLNIINVKNALKACSIRVKQGVLLAGDALGYELLGLQPVLKPLAKLELRAHLKK